MGKDKARPAGLEPVAEVTPEDIAREQRQAPGRFSYVVNEGRLEISSTDQESYSDTWRNRLRFYSSLSDNLGTAMKERLPGQPVMLEVKSQLLGASPKSRGRVHLLLFR